MTGMAIPDPKFQELNLRTAKIKDLGLTIAGTSLEPIVAEFMDEVERAGLSKVRPRVYLSTEWGVPFGTIAIGVPFYLARPELVEVQAERAGHVEGVSRADILRYLRHEMGHVVNYAYKLYEREDWIKVFGAITQPYVEDYSPKPFSRKFVRHLPGWYAQKHPDEDWAETFAVWMTPGRDWRTAYKDWSALAKLEYCDQLISQVRSAPPAVTSDELDEDVGDVTQSLAEFYESRAMNEELPPGVEGAIAAIFDEMPVIAADAPRGSGEALMPAAALIRRLEREIVDNVFRWTGHFPERTRPLVRRLADLAQRMNQVYPREREAEVTVAFTTLVTALAMNHVQRGSYIP